MNKLFIALALFILSNLCVNAQVKLSNELIWASGMLYPETVNGINSMSDGEHFTQLDRDPNTGLSTINKYSYLKYDKLGEIISSSTLSKLIGLEINIDDYSFSADEKAILIATGQESIYRHSSASDYYVYSTEKKTVEPLADFSLGKQRLAEFSPEGNKIAFVRENNIFIKNLETGKEAQVTFDGKMNEIINGGTDWVYEEEFAFDKGFQWSPDGKKIAYYRFDESEVKEFKMEMFGSLYPEYYEYKYPKAGEANSIVNIFVYHIEENRTSPFPLGEESDIYIPRIMWTADANVLMVQRLNRLQNKMELLTADFSFTGPNQNGTKVNTVYLEESKTYVDAHNNTTFFNDGEHFLWSSEKDGYNHIYKVNLNNGKEMQLTKGNWEVTSIYGVDEQNEFIYFQAAKDHPTQREIYRVSASNGKIEKLSAKSGTNEAEFSASYKYFINHHTDANNPHTVTLNENNGKIIKTIVDNAALKSRLAPLNLSKKEFITVKNAEGVDLNAWIIKPKDFNEKQKYPVLMFVYGGPGINTVNDEWEWNNYFWWQLLAQKGYIVVSVDARGTGFRGREFKHCTYLQLGKYETEDQIAAAKFLGKLKYVDAERIGIFGWSYGGYMSSLCITKGADVFKAAIAVAPVTNWRYYDNVYTERFMRTPQENGENYDINSPINHVTKLKGSYLLIHGTGDDNVHVKNAVEMVDALQKANKQFDLMLYPNKNHGIYGGYTRLNLYTKMTNFLLENL